MVRTRGGGDYGSDAHTGELAQEMMKEGYLALKRDYEMMAENYEEVRREAESLENKYWLVIRRYADCLDKAEEYEAELEHKSRSCALISLENEKLVHDIECIFVILVFIVSLGLAALIAYSMNGIRFV